MRRRRPTVLALATLLVSGASAFACSKKDAPPASIANAAPPTLGSKASGGATQRDAAAGDAPPAESDAWRAASSLASEDLGRLALREGSSGLVTGATTPELRRVAAHALAFAEDLESLPFLAEVAGGTDAELALVAAESAVVLAARPRTSVDPEDALEVREGCDRLRAIVGSKDKPKPLRIKVARVLSMLEDRGCARDVPKLE